MQRSPFVNRLTVRAALGMLAAMVIIVIGVRGRMDSLTRFEGSFGSEGRIGGWFVYFRLYRRCIFFIRPTRDHCGRYVASMGKFGHACAARWISQQLPIPPSFDMFRAIGEDSPIITHTVHWVR